MTAPQYNSEHHFCQVLSITHKDLPRGGEILCGGVSVIELRKYTQESITVLGITQLGHGTWGVEIRHRFVGESTCGKS